MTEKRYSINDVFGRHNGWCGYRFLLILSLIVSVVTYTVGAIVTGVVFRAWNRRANCTNVSYDENDREVLNEEMFDYNTPLVVVGPSFMAVGGAILLFLIFQWSFCKPAVKR
ncbi:uncharacterized protein LOC135196201 [Macrobrachium nipponense]|uniref:uncharacterized protein LOC135196201 n=1 Tax=Macrobrachium nipponense TaxID=159736 RepID=UPI0030C8190A